MADRKAEKGNKSLLVLFAKKLAHELEAQLAEKTELYAQVEALRSARGAEDDVTGVWEAEDLKVPKPEPARAPAPPRYAQLKALVSEAVEIAERITQNKADALLIRDERPERDELDVRASLHA